MTRTWVLLVVLACLPAAAGAELGAELRVQGEASFTGQAQGELGWAGSIHDARLGHAGGLPPVRVSGAARLLTYTFAVEQTDGGSPTGYSHHAVLLQQEAQELGPVDGTVAFASPGPRASLRLLPLGAAPVALQGSFSLATPRDLVEQLYYAGDAQPLEATPGFYPRPGALLGGHGLAVAGRSFDGRLVATDLSADLGGRAVDTAWSSSPADLPGLGHVTLRKTRVLVVDGAMQPLADLPAGQWAHAVDGMRASLDGDLVLHNAQGRGHLNGSALPDGFSLFQAVGRMDAEARYGRQAGEWSVQGEPEFVALDARTLAGERWAWLAAEVVAGAGALALLAAAAAKGGKQLVGLLAGLNVAEPTGHRKRMEILRLVGHEPGITLPSIARRVGVGRATVRHHLGVLVRGSLLSRKTVGHSHSFTLNHATFDFPVQPGRGVLAGEALGHFAHPARRAILEALEAAPEATYEEMARHWQAAGAGVLPRSAVTYHCQKLHALGLLGRRSSGRFVHWSLAVDRQRLLEHQREAFTRQASVGAVLRALEDGPRDLPAIQRSLPGGGRGTRRRELAATLAMLEATGYVRQDGAGFVRVAHRAAGGPAAPARPNGFT